MAANVLIRKQRIRLRTSDEQLALQIPKRFGDSLQQELTGMMERVFDHHASSALYINIDKLHIDLGTISTQDFEQQFIKLAEQKLIAELQKQLQEYMEPIYTAAHQDYNFYNDAGSSASFLQLNAATEQELMALIYFLEKGIYPWWYPKAGQKSPADVLDALLNEGTEKFLLKIISLHKKLPAENLSHIIFRLFMYLPQKKYSEVLRSLAKLYNDSNLIANVELLIKNAVWLTIAFSIPERVFYKHGFSFLLQQQRDANENFFLNFFLKISTDESISGADLRKNESKKPLADVEIIQAFADIIAIIEPDPSRVNTELSIIEPDPSRVNTELSITPIEKDVKRVPPHQHQAVPDHAIYINNAGLLLLHPFLQYLFSDAGLLTGANQFISESAQQKAAVLLYYLQSGNAVYKEWEMPLNKILCGMDYQSVLADNLLLSATDELNCDNLLLAVVNHWTALKGAGIDALRNTFLLRECKISKKEDYWLMQVERTGADVLLDRLPWGIGIIKLPWINQLIHTEW